MKLLNDPRPWWGTLRGAPLSVAQLIENGTLSSTAAATLGWALAHGASLFVAGGPPGAGKSTLATALLEYLPREAHLYVTSGAWDRMQVPAVDDGPVYLLINELSYHMPMYLSGRAAQAAFELLASGVRMIGTLHARSAREAVEVMCDEADVDRSMLSAGFVIAVIEAGWKNGRVERRVAEIGFLPPAGEVVTLPDGVAALAAWSGVARAQIEAEIAARVAPESA
jgi:type IV secretory pathway ATPase VirB11/archaellum biosynthesis ATPase